VDTFKNRNKVFFSTFASNISYDISKMRLLLLYLTSFSCSVSSTPLSGKIYGKHFEGDIAIKNPERFKKSGILRAFVKNKELRWGKTIQYTIGPDLEEYTDTIRSCLDWISERSCLVFVKGDTGDHIKFTSFGDNDNDGSGCWSYFGRRGGAQAVNLEIPSCLTKDTIFHEVFHALGKVHEQSRPDRDDHVEVLLKNVEPGQEDQFEIKKNVDVANTGYDLMSIMHYAPTAFSKNGKPTIQAKSGTVDFGQSETPTETDLWELNHAYGCKQGDEDDTSGSTESPFYYYLSDYEDYEEYPNVYNDYQEVEEDEDQTEEEEEFEEADDGQRVEGEEGQHDFPHVIDETGVLFSPDHDDSDYTFDNDTVEYEYQ